jgi:hypothetical protein
VPVLDKGLFGENTNINNITGRLENFNIHHKPATLMATFHPSGTMFMDGIYTTEFVMLLALISALNAWPTVMYINPLAASYAGTDTSSPILSTLQFLYSGCYVNVPYRALWH